MILQGKEQRKTTIKIYKEELSSFFRLFSVSGKKKADEQKIQIINMKKTPKVL